MFRVIIQTKNIISLSSIKCFIFLTLLNDCFLLNDRTVLNSESFTLNINGQLDTFKQSVHLDRNDASHLTKCGVA